MKETKVTFFDFAAIYNEEFSGLCQCFVKKRSESEKSQFEAEMKR